MKKSVAHKVEYQQQPTQQTEKKSKLLPLLQAHLEEKAVLLAARRVKSICHLDKDITRLGLDSTNFEALHQFWCEA